MTGHIDGGKVVKAQIDIVSCGRDILGESPVWSVCEQALYWVDIRRKLLRRYQPDRNVVNEWPLGTTVGSVALRASGGVILSLTPGIAGFSPETGIMQLVQSPEVDIPTQRFNDGRCDPRGRFWIGTMSDVAREPSGSLYRFDPDLSCEKAFSGITIPNSLCWSPDGRRMYFADTISSSIFTFEYDLDDGTICNKRVFADTSGRRGRPDGSTVDEEGCLWNAEFDSWCVTRYAPDGTIDRFVELPTQCPTSCAFGGPFLATLYVTTARHRLTTAEEKSQPLSGSLFAIDVGVKGLPEPEFAG